MNPHTENIELRVGPSDAYCPTTTDRVSTQNPNSPTANVAGTSRGIDPYQPVHDNLGIYSGLTSSLLPAYTGSAPTVVSQSATTAATSYFSAPDNAKYLVSESNKFVELNSVIKFPQQTPTGELSTQLVEDISHGNSRSRSCSGTFLNIPSYLPKTHDKHEELIPNRIVSTQPFAPVSERHFPQFVDSCDEHNGLANNLSNSYHRNSNFGTSINNSINYFYENNIHNNEFSTALSTGTYTNPFDDSHLPRAQLLNPTSIYHSHETFHINYQQTSSDIPPNKPEHPGVICATGMVQYPYSQQPYDKRNYVQPDSTTPQVPLPHPSGFLSGSTTITTTAAAPNFAYRIFNQHHQQTRQPGDIQNPIHDQYQGQHVNNTNIPLPNSNKPNTASEIVVCNNIVGSDSELSVSDDNDDIDMDDQCDDVTPVDRQSGNVVRLEAADSSCSSPSLGGSDTSYNSHGSDGEPVRKSRNATADGSRKSGRNHHQQHNQHHQQSAKQRHMANMRERRRMKSINKAFELLRTKIPTFPYEKKLSKVDTLRMAIRYIAHLSEMMTEDAAGDKSAPGKGSTGSNAGNRRAGGAESRRRRVAFQKVIINCASGFTEGLTGFEGIHRLALSWGRASETGAVDEESDWGNNPTLTAKIWTPAAGDGGCDEEKTDKTNRTKGD